MLTHANGNDEAILSRSYKVSFEGDSVEKLHFWLNVKNFRSIQKVLYFLSEGLAKIWCQSL